MVKGVGLDPGEFAVKAVELDGSFKRPRLIKATVDEVAQATISAADPVHATTEANALLRAVRDNKIHKQNVVLGFPSREALFRQLVVPFTGTERIRKVIKFEAESEIHSQSVDDMVVDFHVVEEIEDETKVLVAGVPKNSLRTTLDALDRVGIEPEVVDLDTMALLRVAEWSGALAPDDGLVDTEGSADTSRLVLDIGARSVRVLVVTDGHLQDMRAIPLGIDSIAEDLAVRADCTLSEAREALRNAVAGQDYVGAAAPAALVEEAEDAADAEAVDGDEEGEVEEMLPAAPTAISFVSIDQARDKFLARLKREFMRFIVASPGVGEVEAVFTTGGGSKFEGIDAVIEEVFECAPQPLLYMDLLQHDLDEAEARRLEPLLTTAVGLALGRLGGIAGFNFRQEDLVYTRGFDRIKLPLAIASMLALFALVVYGMVLKKELLHKESLYGFAIEKEKKVTGRQKTRSKTEMQYSGYLGFLVNKPSSWPARKLRPAEYDKVVNALADAPTFNRIQSYHNQLSRILRDVQREGEYDPNLSLDSATAVLQQFAQLISSLEEPGKLGRFYIGGIDVNLPSNRREKGRLDIKVFFRGSDFRERAEILESEIAALFTEKESAFGAFRLPKKGTPYPEVPGAMYDFYIQLKPKIEVQDLK